MKKIKAIIGFAGKITLAVGEKAEVSDEIADDLLRAGFVEEISEKTAPKKEEVKKSKAKK